jgi:hypothetical protein
MSTHMTDRRKKGADRTPLTAAVVVRFSDKSGASRTVSGRTADQSTNGLGLVLPRSLDIGLTITVDICVQHASGTSAGAREGVVRWCRRKNDNEFAVGVALAACSSICGAFEEDLYEILQVHMNADVDTIHKVYRFLAMRYHPDNLETGDAARFRQLLEAYQVLTDPEKRAAFDVWHRKTCRRQWKIFESASVTTGTAAEKRKRDGLLQALYTKRLADPDQPCLSFRDFEQLLACPREHLEFALWYLKERGYVSRTDNGKFQMTVTGVDVAEALITLETRTRGTLQITA